MNKKATGIFFACLCIVISALLSDFITKQNREPAWIIVNPPTPVESSGSAVTKATKRSRQASNAPTETTITTAVIIADPVDEGELYIDINSASAEELMKLKGIGEHLASEIIAYRENCGGFANIEEIMNVAGIGEGIFGDICGNIYVVEPYYPEIPEDDPPAYEEPPVLRLEDVSPIDLNSADIELLILLPHVDEEVAQRIIDLRAELGRFSNGRELAYIEELSMDEVTEILEYVTAE